MKRYTVLLVVLATVSCAAPLPTPMPTEATTTTRPPTLLINAPPPTHALGDPSSTTEIVTPTMMPMPGEAVTSVSAFFPLGFMWIRMSSLGQVAAGGFNVAHRWAGGWEIAEAEAYLNQAEAVGLQVIGDLLACRAFDTGHPYCEGLSVWDEQEWGEYISALSTHDNLVAWFLPDEIDDYEVAASLYEWVQEYDPRQRPVYGNPGSFELETIQRFPAFSDFIWGAWYPEYYGVPRAVVTYGTKLDAVACQGTDTRWGAILQFFDSAEYGASGGYPTAHELRCDSYQAVIAGATGLWYFTYERGKDLDGLLAELETIADEIVGAGGLAEVILSPEVSQTITKTVVLGPTQSPQSPPGWGEVYDSIQTLQKEYQGTYLFAVNIATDTVVVEFGNLPTEVDTVEVLFEGRAIPVSDGRFRDSFAEADVHIYHAAGSAIFLPLVMKFAP
jgi:hypothetical protein